ncbi:hypothetical protein IQ22_02335 [Pseudomonas duriflava]|uniref:Uncharacterized protein n=1 Tax=Pseudomonas duriflava TaxID=459528 RepID=A0A562QC25_9PSED|nr:hypothetical protein [Pseudomonas duriflava]TWI53730.1 hypothetical protein IQ22_02335 [Pseudomonas duriflava]
MTDMEDINPDAIDTDPEIQPDPDEAPVQEKPKDSSDKESLSSGSV